MNDIIIKYYIDLVIGSYLNCFKSSNKSIDLGDTSIIIYLNLQKTIINNFITNV